MPVKAESERSLVMDPTISELVRMKMQSTSEETKKSITIDIWDFAGHDIYYTTHQV